MTVNRTGDNDDGSDDDRPTPELGYAAQSDPLEHASRRGIPTPARSVPSRPSRQVVVVAPEDDDPDSQDEPPAVSSLERRVLAIERRDRGRRKWIAGAVISAGSALGAVLVWALNAREAAGDEKSRLRHLERAVERLELYTFPPPPPRWPWRRSEQPDYAPRPVAPSDPEPKGTAP